MCVERCGLAMWCCETHCNGCMNAQWALFWGGGRSTKPCVFPCKVVAAGDERYLVCAAVAAAVVSVANWFLLFPECVARVPVSLWGSGGWGCVRSTLRSRSQPFATVRNRLCEDRMAVPMGSFAEVVLFGGFRRLVASFRVAGVALRDIQTCSGTCRKSFCVAGAILLWRFQKMCCSFRGRRSTLDVSIVIFRGRRSTLDVSCCVFFANRIGSAASSGDKVHIPWQAWHFVRCAENWWKPRTKHRFWGCKFSGSKENS